MIVRNNPTQPSLLYSIWILYYVGNNEIKGFLNFISENKADINSYVIVPTYDTQDTSKVYKDCFFISWK